MKKQKMLVLLVGLLVFLVGIVGSIAIYKVNHTVVIEAYVKEMLGETLQDIEAIDIVGEEKAYLKKENGVWINTQLPGLTYNQEKVAAVVAEWENLQSVHYIKNAKELDTYGILEGATYVTLHDKDGIAETFVLGDKVANEKAIYLWNVQEEKMYAIAQDAITAFSEGQAYWIDQSINLPNIETITSLAVTQNGESMMQVVDGYVTAPFHMAAPVVSETVATYLEQLLSLEKVCLVADTKAVETGLENPSLKIDLGQDVSLSFGNTQDGNTYFQLSTEPFIYMVKEAVVKDLRSIDAFKWIQKEIYVPVLEELTQLTIDYDKEQMVLEIGTNQDEQLEAEEGVENQVDDQFPTLETATVETVVENRLPEEAFSVRIGEDICTPEAVESLLTALSGVQKHSVILNGAFEQQQQRDAEIKVTYVYVDGTSRTLEFVPYDPKYYLLREDGYTQFSVDKKQLLAVIDAVKQMTFISSDATVNTITE